MKKIWLSFLLLSNTIYAAVSSINNIDAIAGYRPSKNIIFCSQGGGSSHHLWVMELLKESYHRGHNVSFYSNGDQLQFSKDYPMVQTHEIGGHTSFVTRLATRGMTAHLSNDIMGYAAAKASVENYKQIFVELKDVFQREKPDLAICDGFVIACADVSKSLGIPVVMTSTANFFIDGRKPFVNNRIYTLINPTTLNESIWLRLYNNFYRQPLLRWQTKQELTEVFTFQRQMGFEPALDAADERFRSVTKLINNMYGLEVPREMSQLAHLVGPILRKSFPNMEREVSSFLDVHKNTVYIAFGQHALPAPGDIKMILATLFKLKKEGALDGIIWARIDSDMLPQDINEDLSLIMDDGKNITDFLMLPWAPQFAILQHPSTIMFIGHGGAGSIHESLYSRKRMFVFPFFADQSYHGQMLEKNGLGSYIQTENIKYTKSDYDTLYNRLKRVLLDETGDIQNAVDRYGTMLQIRSTHAVTNSVDILEECLFSSNDEGVLWYRQGIEQELNWLKQNDIDLYLVLAVFGLGGYKAFKRYFTTKPKMKTN